jgi:hypothetical protein
MSFPIYEPVKEVLIRVTYIHYDILTETSKEVNGDCYARTIDQLRDYLKRYPGIAGSLNYGKNIRPDLQAKLHLTWVDKSGTCTTEFDDARKFIAFVKERPALAKALGYQS